jgi:hypothetical protein
VDLRLGASPLADEFFYNVVHPQARHSDAYREADASLSQVYPDYMQSSMHYQEFVGDVLVAVMTGNLNAVPDAVQGLPPPEDASYRSLLPQTRLTKGSWLVEEPAHTMLAPSRIVVGRLLAKAATPEERKRILRLTLQATVDELRATWLTPDGDYMKSFLKEKFHGRNAQQATNIRGSYNPKTDGAYDYTIHGPATPKALGYNSENKLVADVNRGLIRRIRELVQKPRTCGEIFAAVGR